MAVDPNPPAPPAPPAPPVPPTPPAPAVPPPAPPTALGTPNPGDVTPPTPPTPPAPPAPPVVVASALTVPEGALLRPADLEGIAGEAKTLGLTQEQAQQLVTTRATALGAVAERYLADLTTDPKLGGAHLDATRELAQKGLTAVTQKAGLSAEELAHVRAFFDGVDGNHKAFVRLFHYLGGAMREDQPPAGGAPPRSDKKSTADVLYPSTAKAS